MSLLTMRKTWVLGLLTWLLPFVFSMFFFNRDGSLNIDVFLFKSIMIVLFGGIGAFLLAQVLRDVTADFVTAALVLGLIWFVINIGLDLIVLIGLFGNDLGAWFVDTGLRYLLIPVTAVAMGWLLLVKDSD